MDIDERIDISNMTSTQISMIIKDIENFKNKETKNTKEYNICNYCGKKASVGKYLYNGLILNCCNDHVPYCAPRINTLPF